jgi:aliphatic nitrilase
LIVFPETFLPGYPYWAIVRDPTETGPFMRRLHEQAVELESPAMAELGTAAREAGCYIAMGLHEKDGGTLYNTTAYLDPDGKLLGRHRKLVPTNHERMVWGRGDGRDMVVFDTPIGVIGGLICFEHGNALFRYAIQAQGEQIHVATWPGGMNSLGGVIDAAIRHYAFEAQAFVVNATSILTDEIIDRLGPGGSVGKLSPSGGQTAIVGPRGEYLAGPVKGVEEAVIYAELDPQKITDAKTVMDCAGHYARPDVVRLELSRSPGDPLTVVD